MPQNNLMLLLIYRLQCFLSSLLSGKAGPLEVAYLYGMLCVTQVTPRLTHPIVSSVGHDRFLSA